MTRCKLWGLSLFHGKIRLQRGCSSTADRFVGETKNGSPRTAVAGELAGGLIQQIDRVIALIEFTAGSVRPGRARAPLQGIGGTSLSSQRNSAQAKGETSGRMQNQAGSLRQGQSSAIGEEVASISVFISARVVGSAHAGSSSLELHGEPYPAQARRPVRTVRQGLAGIYGVAP